ncbi:GlmU family protein [Halocola ammonii]
MNNYLLFEDNREIKFRPLSLTRHLSNLRFGISTLKEKWELMLKSSTSCHLIEERRYLGKKYHGVYTDNNILINSRIIPDSELIAHIHNLELNTCLTSGNTILACRLGKKSAESFDPESESENTQRREYTPKNTLFSVKQITDIFSKNREAISFDFKLLTKGRTSLKLSDSVHHIGKPEDLFLEEGAKVPLCSINTSSGPVYIGKNVEVMEGAMLRGPLALCDHSVVKMGAKVYGASTVGPWSKIGGEVNNCVFQGYSNKAHDGFLGNSVIGEWCNLGADTNCSNLKNNYGSVRIWDFQKEDYASSGLIFCGLLMGDHSKCGINTMFNTGTTVGVNANIFGGGFPPKYIPSFSWGGENTWEEYNLDKALDVAETVYARRNLELEETDREILKYIFENTRHSF